MRQAQREYDDEEDEELIMMQKLTQQTRSTFGNFLNGDHFNKIYKQAQEQQ